MKRVIIYTRLSDPGEAKKEDQLSFDEQERICREWLARSGEVEIVGVEREEGVSGALIVRPAMDRIVDRASRNEIDAVIVSRTNRLARDVSVAGWLRVELGRHGVEVLIAGIDTSTEAGQVQVWVEDGVAGWQRNDLLRSLQGGYRAHVKKGILMVAGTPPYGYTYQYDPIGKRKMYALNPEEAHWVKQIFAWCGEEGLSMNQAAVRLNQLGTPTKRSAKGWAAGHISNILANSVYYGRAAYYKEKSSGKSRYGGKVTRTPTDPSQWLYVDLDPSLVLVDKEVWDKANALRERNRVYGGKSRKQYLLSGGVLRCSECGYTYCGDVCRNKVVYRCCGRVRQRAIYMDGKTCSVPQVTGPRIEEEVWGQLVRYLRNLSMLDWSEMHSPEQAETMRSQEERDRETLAGLDVVEQAIKAEEVELARQLTKKKVSEDVYDVLKAEIEDRRRGVALQRAEIGERLRASEEIEAEEENLKQWLDIISMDPIAFARKLQNASFDLQRRVIDATKLKVLLFPGGRDFHLDAMITERVFELVWAEIEREIAEMDARGEIGQGQGMDGAVSNPDLWSENPAS